ncbi:MAG: plasmid pRiA4b ORF-3 family protein [bacterium]
MKEEFIKVYQFKIVLDDTNPPVWRRIQVPENYSFWDLHVAIQDSMGWTDSHLHEFIMKNLNGKQVNLGIPDEEYDDHSDRFMSGWEYYISDYFSIKNKRALYVYDFGDGWEHTIILEKLLIREKGKDYPICIDGERACPPEDCGSIPGYEDICAGTHEFQEEYDNEGYDPKKFDVNEVVFDDPKERLDRLFDEAGII